MKLIPSFAVASAVIALAFHPTQALANSPRPGGDSSLSTTEETFSLPIAEADQLLHEVSSDALRYARLREMLASGKARLERLTVLRTTTGQRAVAESMNELRYGSEFRVGETPSGANAGEKSDKPASQAVQPAGAVEKPVQPITYETRNVGDTLELEPVLAPDEVTITLNIVPQSVRYVGDYADNGLYPGKTPIFETSKITTSVTVRDGQPYFLGTLNPPFANGLAHEQKEQRVWLDFVTVHIVRLEENRVLSKNAAELIAKAKAIIIAKLDFHEVPLTKAVEALHQKSVESDPQKKGVAIVVKKLPRIEGLKVTLSLTNVPLEDVLWYLAEELGLTVDPTDYALLLR